MKIGVIIARFQSPFLHEGHIKLIEEVRANHNRVVIVLGVSKITGSRKNPFDFPTRERLIKNKYPEMVVLPLADHPDDNVWSKKLDDLLSDAFPGSGFVLYGSRDSFIPYYFGTKETVELAEHGDFNATEIRQKYADKVFESEDFRAGILYATHNQYTKVYPTVDVAVFRNNKTEILLGKKNTNYKWRFIGGFTDATDADYETAALRELQEEAGDLEVSAMTYETSAKIDDWRYRNEADKIITTLFSCDYIFGTPKAQDDIIDVEWVPMKDLPTLFEKGETSPEHGRLFQHIIDKYIK